MILNPLIENAYKVLDGGELSRGEALALAREIEGEDLLDLLSLANKVRKRFAPAFHKCSIINARSGRCSERCRFCAQSATFPTHIETYPLLEPEAVLKCAEEIYAQGVRSFGYVTSGRGWRKCDADFEKVLRTMDLLHERLPDMELCVSLGILSEECVKLLAAHHVKRYNMNLQTAPERYAELITETHPMAEKIETIRLMAKYGIGNCTGGIIGLGESWEDRIDMAFAVRGLPVDRCPLNVLQPIPGTPLEGRPLTTPAEAAKFFAIFRLINPKLMLKFCAGRETVMKDFQGLLMLSGLNALMTGGYLTTRGREIGADNAFLTALEQF